MKHKRTEASKSYATLIEEAESAVASVKDERLREIAFERVLDHLLATSGDQAFSLNKNDTRSYKTAATTKRNKAPKSGGPLITLRELVDENFFSEPRSLRDILDEFNKRSQRLKPTDLTKPLQIVCRQKLLRRDKQSPANGGKKVFHWYNW